MEGWIKLHRNFDSWEWYNKSEMVHLFIHLLIHANCLDGDWRGISIKKGQILTGVNSLNEATKISVQSIRTCLKRLEKTKEINIQTTNKYSIITICNYDTYQSNQQTTNKQTNKQLTNNQQTTNYKQEEEEKKEGEEGKEEKKIKLSESDKIKILSARKKSFYNSLIPFIDQFGKDNLRDFYNYWTEPNKSLTKLKYELERTWELNLRLHKWDRTGSKFGKINNASKIDVDNVNFND